MSLVSRNLLSNSPLLPKQNIWQFDRETTILVETFGTLCVSGDENAIQFAPSPHPLDSVGCLQVNHLLPILHRLRTPTLFGGVGGGDKSC